jgi:PAS domain S-box-containing protein
MSILDLNSSESIFSKILDSAPDSIVIVDSSGEIQIVNIQTENIFGYSRSELIGKKVEMLIPGEYRDKHIGHREHYNSNVSFRPMGSGLELFGLRKDGSKFPVEISLSPLNTPEGIYVAAAIRDITKRKKIEKDLLALNRKLEESNKELEAFSYSVSHDLRAPLRHIIGFSEKLSRTQIDKLDVEGQRLLHIIVDSASEMSVLIEKLLEFSRIGRLELSKGKVNMGQLIIEVKNELMKLNSSQKFEWHINDLPTVYGDKFFLKLVIQNLLANAIKYSSGKEVTIINAKASEKENEYVFEISDNGIGFDNKYSENLFGVFNRLHRAEDFEGSGIGLATVKRIVQRHGGRVWADGEQEKGATFYFTLPKN